MKSLNFEFKQLVKLVSLKYGQLVLKKSLNELLSSSSKPTLMLDETEIKISRTEETSSDKRSPPSIYEIDKPPAAAAVR
jgi:hypothetical protein